MCNINDCLYFIIFNLKMRKKVAPLNYTQPPINSTSRHELKDLKMTKISAIEEDTINLSNLKLKFLMSQLAKKIRYLSPPC